MSVEKVDLQGVQPETKQTFQGKKSVPSDIPESNDEEKRNAAKLMKGAAALAVLAAAGIIGHKTGAFKKLGKMVSGESSQLGKNAEKAADEAAEVVTNAGKKAEEAAKPLQDKTAKATEKAAETLNTPKTFDELAEEALKAGKKTFEKEYYDNGSRMIKTFDAKTRKTIAIKEFIGNDKIEFLKSVKHYDPETGKILIKHEEFYLGQIGKIYDYDPKTGNLLKETFYNPDGITKSGIVEYDAKTGKDIKSTFCDDNGNIESIYERDPKSGELRRTVFDIHGNPIKE